MKPILALFAFCILSTPALALPTPIKPRTCPACAPCECKGCECSINKPITDREGNEIYRARHPATWPVRVEAVREKGFYLGPFRRLSF